MGTLRLSLGVRRSRDGERAFDWWLKGKFIVIDSRVPRMVLMTEDLGIRVYYYVLLFGAQSCDRIGSVY